MTLATRCPACGTSFRVVQDQLKVSAGWVRCGRCSEVFNAVAALFEIDASGQEAWRGQQEAQTPAEPPTTFEPDVELAPGPRPAPDEVPAPDDAATEPVAAAIEPTPTTNDQPAVEPEFSAYQAPTFVRDADRAARWRHPALRAALWAAAPLLAVALGIQVTLLYRDAVAARWPAARPALDEACAWAGCRVEPLRRINGLAVDASGLTQLEGTTIYRLAVVLRNRAELELLVPALDLVLTDTQGLTVARRVLSAAELGSTSRTLAAGGELSLQANLNAGDRRVAGYTIEIFYP